MKRQNEMMASFMIAHRQFMENLEDTVKLLDQDIQEAAEMGEICTDEWCLATEHTLDELANLIFSISEPRWASLEDSQKIKSLRHRVHDLYAQYKSISAKK
jgi:hypothetical protein